MRLFHSVWHSIVGLKTIATMAHSPDEGGPHSPSERQIFLQKENANNHALVKEENVCRALQDLQQTSGSTLSDIQKRLFPSGNPSPTQLRSFKLATARALRSGQIERGKNNHLFRLAFLNEDEDSLVGSKYHRRRYACKKSRKNRSYCSRYKVRCCKRRKKSCGSKKRKPKKKKPKKKKKKSCGKKKARKPKKKAHKKKKCGGKKKRKKRKRSHKPKPKPNPYDCPCG
ncbi:hypothetical protein ElyMa_004893000 [Elysia marginata]|uniref:H15 domain-containing protein n=1 Tax=Elysia marginata TaxID=1093978 RepID=A0AAV4IWK1_9GAST|nr:hypothetical protein ElyMa_004893000 [Elysia marginata]